MLYLHRDGGENWPPPIGQSHTIIWTANNVKRTWFKKPVGFHPHFCIIYCPVSGWRAGIKFAKLRGAKVGSVSDHPHFGCRQHQLLAGIQSTENTCKFRDSGTSSPVSGYSWPLTSSSCAPYQSNSNSEPGSVCLITRWKSNPIQTLEQITSSEWRCCIGWHWSSRFVKPCIKKKFQANQHCADKRTVR